MSGYPHATAITASTVRGSLKHPRSLLAPNILMKVAADGVNVLTDGIRQYGSREVTVM